MNKINFTDGGINRYPFIDEHIEKDIYVKEDKNIIVFVDSLPEKNLVKKKNEIWIYIQVESWYIISYRMKYVYDYDFDLILTFAEHFYNKKKPINFYLIIKYIG